MLVAPAGKSDADGSGVFDTNQIADAYDLGRQELWTKEVLKRRGRPVPPTGKVEPTQRDAVYEDLARVGLVHASEQLHEGGLAGSVLTDKSDGCSRRKVKRDIGKDLARRSWIPEADVVEADPAREPVRDRQTKRRNCRAGGIVLDPEQS